MKKIILLLCAIVSSLQFNYCQTLPDSTWYLGQTKPGKTQTLFPLDVSSGFSAVEKMAFSADGKVIYYSELNVNPAYTSFSESRIKYYRYSDDEWKGPYLLFEHYHSPTLTVFGDTMFLQHGNPSEVWYAEKTDTGWSTPSKFMEGYNLNGGSLFEGKLLETSTGSYYYVSTIATGGIGGTDVAKILINSTDTTIQSLGRPLNNSGDNNYFYMAKDESYAITYTLQGGDHQEGRALISYPKENGSWTNPKQMGFGGWAVALSPDEKYLFHSSYDGSRFDTYWIQIDEIIDSLKHTNFLPYILNALPDQSDSLGNEYSLSIPDSTFIDDDGNHTLSYSATLSNKNNLPTWLSFNAETRVLSGMLTEAGNFKIKITATDTAGMSIYDIFNLEVKAAITTINNMGENNNISVFPNPAKSEIQIDLGKEILGTVYYQIFDISGKIISYGKLQSEIIDISALKKGMYILNLRTEKDMISKKIIIE